jgi:hypothetical protein
VWKFFSFIKMLFEWKNIEFWEHSGAIFVYISSITCALCKTSSDWIRVLVAVTNEILKRAGDDDYLRGATSINHQVALRANFKMYSRSAKEGEKGDPNCNHWLAKMYTSPANQNRFVIRMLESWKWQRPVKKKLICDKFNLEALIVNQVKVSKLWQTGKIFSLEHW